jgi:acyl-[acyl-carrier-protein]-phospholipid O-acyltransferase/long-chain-fatty-acid--[acyl-carrier-protein] ligase
MVSLTTVEDIAARLWPGHLHAAVNLADERKGERILLVTQYHEAQRTDFVRAVQEQGFSEFHAPREILYTKELPLLGSGKIDYPALTELVLKAQNE